MRIFTVSYIPLQIPTLAGLHRPREGFLRRGIGVHLSSQLVRLVPQSGAFAMDDIEERQQLVLGGTGAAG